MGGRSINEVTKEVSYGEPKLLMTGLCAFAPRCDVKVKKTDNRMRLASRWSAFQAMGAMANPKGER